MLPSYFDIWIGEDPLIIVTSEQVLQFSAQGSFVRTLVISGRGPEEFYGIRSFAVDEASGRLYYSEVGSPGVITVNTDHVGFLLR